MKRKKSKQSNEPLWGAFVIMVIILIMQGILSHINPEFSSVILMVSVIGHVVNFYGAMIYGTLLDGGGV